MKLDIGKDQDVLKAQTRYYLGEELWKWIKDHENLQYTWQPNEEEFKLIHNFYRTKHIDSPSIHDTTIKSNVIVHRQMKNAHGKMFGGYLMHKAIEQGFICAQNFTGE